MVTQKPANRDEFVRALLSGDLDPASAEVERVFAEDPAVRAEFEELRELDARLAEGGRTERDVLASLSSAEDLPTDEAALQALQEGLLAGKAGGAAPRPARSPLRVYGPAFAAAAAVILLWSVIWRNAGEAPKPVYTLGSELPAVYPEGVVEAYSLFQWDFSASPGGHVDFVIWSGGADARAREHITRRLEADEESRVQLTEKEAAGLPPSIQWSATGMDAFGDPDGQSVSASAQRASP